MNYLYPATIWLMSRQKYITSKSKLVRRTFRVFTRKSLASSIKIPSPFKINCRKKPTLFNVILPFLSCAGFSGKIVLSEEFKNDIEENITHLIVLARMALEKGDSEKAEALLYMGLKICEDYNVSYGLPFIYDILASIAFAQGDLEKAEILLVTVIEKMIADGVPEDDDHIVDFKLRLARVYSSYHDDLLAEIGFKNCLALQQEKIYKSDINTKTGILYVNVLFWYGVHMTKNSRNVEAKKMLDEAYEYSTKIRGLSPYQEMVIMYTLADLNLELGDYDVALDSMLTAVMLGKGISSSDLPKCYVKLAKIYMKMEIYDQARMAAEEGAKLGRLFGRVDAVNEARRVLDKIRVSQN